MYAVYKDLNYVRNFNNSLYYLLWIIWNISSLQKIQQTTLIENNRLFCPPPPPPQKKKKKSVLVSVLRIKDLSCYWNKMSWLRLAFAQISFSFFFCSPVSIQSNRSCLPVYALVLLIICFVVLRPVNQYSTSRRRLVDTFLWYWNCLK